LLIIADLSTVLLPFVAVLLPVLAHLFPVARWQLVRPAFPFEPVAQRVPPVSDCGIGRELAGPRPLIAQTRQRSRRAIANAVGEARAQRGPCTEGRQVRDARPTTDTGSPADVRAVANPGPSTKVRTSRGQRRDSWSADSWTVADSASTADAWSIANTSTAANARSVSDAASTGNPRAITKAASTADTLAVADSTPTADTWAISDPATSG
jgi:hypothetical protein